MQTSTNHVPGLFYPATMLRMAFAFVVIACQTSPDEKITSTSISTGNPVGLTFHMEKDSKPIAFTGTLEIYETNQIPVEGYRPDPLLRIQIENSDSILLDISAITAIPHALWWDSLAEDSADAYDTLLKFNVVFKGDSLGAILKGFSFDTRSRRFIPSMDTVGADSGGSVHARLSRLVDFTGWLPPNLIHRLKDFYLFIYGTGYYTKGIRDATNGDSLLFNLPKLPEGQHDAFLTSFPIKGNSPSSGSDSTDVLTLKSPLHTDSNALQRGQLDRRIELPDSLKFP
jgi:hypothetical protein